MLRQDANSAAGMILCGLLVLVTAGLGLKHGWNLHGLAIPAGRPQPAGIPEGSQAPGFQLKDVNGNDVSLSNWRGRVVLLDFWATWCPPCEKELPHIQTIYEDFFDDGLVVLAISIDREKAAVKPFIERNGYTFPVLCGFR